jgi:hypothetical protein
METEAAIAFLRAEFDREERGGFPRLARVPDTNVRRFLHYFRGLAKSDAELLKSAIAKYACRFIAPSGYGVRLADLETLALERKARAFTMIGYWRFMALKNLKLAAGMSRSEHPGMKKQMLGFQMPADVLGRVDGLTACKASELRKLVKHAFAVHFGFVAESIGGGNWVYRRADGEESFEVAIDYGARFGQQLGYSVQLSKRGPGDPPSQLCFEAILGAGFGNWNFITEATATQDIALLVELVEHVVRFAARLKEVPQNGNEPDAAPQ